MYIEDPRWEILVEEIRLIRAKLDALHTPLTCPLGILAAEDRKSITQLELWKARMQGAVMVWGLLGAAVGTVITAIVAALTLQWWDRSP